MLWARLFRAFCSIKLEHSWEYSCIWYSIHQFTETTNIKSTASIASSTTSIESIICGPTNTAMLLWDGQCLVCGQKRDNWDKTTKIRFWLELKFIYLPNIVKQHHLLVKGQVSVPFSMRTLIQLVVCTPWGMVVQHLGHLRHGNADSYLKSILDSINQTE